MSLLLKIWKNQLWCNHTFGCATCGSNRYTSAACYFWILSSFSDLSAQRSGREAISTCFFRRRLAPWLRFHLVSMAAVVRNPRSVWTTTNRSFMEKFQQKEMGVSKNRGFLPPKGMVKIKGKPLLKWMIWGVLPLFWVQHPNASKNPESYSQHLQSQSWILGFRVWIVSWFLKFHHVKSHW